ncbi:hypothetical protein [Lentibacillus persicus]|uniref:hypothetical protein n=1 Tax=Lentibacillus persicus TaxID=640948 RepID=UPI001C432E47|nr:hypothetical protein [Lentibacillus persicus]
MKQHKIAWLFLKHGEDLHFPISSSSGFSSPFAFLFSYKKTKGPAEKYSAGFFLCYKKGGIKQKKPLQL